VTSALDFLPHQKKWDRLGHERLLAVYLLLPPELAKPRDQVLQVGVRRRGLRGTETREGF
jgi:hypothetical protein